MSGDRAPGGSGVWRPSVILAVVAVAVAAYVLLQPRPPLPAEEGPTHADSHVVSEFSGVATVSDGDTLRIGARRIRLDGVIAPERSIRCGDVNVYRAAADALRSATGSQRVTCRISDVPDAHGQDMAQCRVGDIDLNAHMVTTGWARDWPLHSGGAYADEEAEARAARRGIWGLSCPADLWAGTGLAE